MTPAGGFRLTYQARCNQLNVTPHEPLINYVEQLGVDNIRVLNLGKVQGIELLDLRPVTMALLHNVFFVAIVINDVNKPQALMEFTQLVATNRTLIELSVAATNPVKGSVGTLGDCLLKNPCPSLEVLNLRGNKISEDEGLKLGLGLSSYKHFLTAIDLSGCGLSGKGVIGVFVGLGQNRNICTYLRVLNVSNNKLSGLFFSFNLCSILFFFFFFFFNFFFL